MANIIFNKSELRQLMKSIDNEDTIVLETLEDIRKCLSDMTSYWQTNSEAAHKLEELVSINQQVARNYREFKIEFLDALEQIGISYEESDINAKTSVASLGKDLAGVAVSQVVQPLAGSVKNQVSNLYNKSEQVRDSVFSSIESGKDMIVDGVKDLTSDKNDRLLSTHEKEHVANRVFQTAKDMNNK